MKLSFVINDDCDLIIKPGQKVDFKDPLIKKQSSKEIKIPLSEILKLSPSQIFKSLKKFVGETVKKGEVLAEHNGLLSKKHYRSEFDGIIKEINHNEGVIIIETLSENQDTVCAFFKGEVAHIEKNEITLEVGQCHEYELKEVTEDFGGEFLIVADRMFDKLTEDEVQNKIIISEKLVPFEQVKLEALGAKGFVTLLTVQENTKLPNGLIKQIQDWQTIKSLKFPYCIISKKLNKIYIYA